MAARAIWAACVVCGVLLAPHASAQNAPPCPLRGEKTMALAELFFGLSVPGRGPVTGQEWRKFTSSTLTRYFPDGFTAFDGSGQWMDPRTHHVVREPAKVVIVVANDDAQFAKNIVSVADAYRAEFRQQSVGVVTQKACAAF
jgi:hypothetical protein